jgi:transcriptional regulator with XRE-family HTH domain
MLSEDPNMKLRLKEVREKKNWSQMQLEMKSGVSRNFISEIENEKFIPTIKVICKLCRALDCTPNDLIDCGDEGR